MQALAWNGSWNGESHYPSAASAGQCDYPCYPC